VSLDVRPVIGRFAVSVVAGNMRQLLRMGCAVKLTFVGKDPESNPNGSPTVYRTDRGSWVVQGWGITDPDALAAMDIPDGESAVEIPDRMIQFFGRSVSGADGVDQ